MAYIETRLAGRNDVTPTFFAEEIGGRGHVGENLHIATQASRASDSSTSIDIALDVCIALEDGTLHQMHDGTSLINAWWTLDSDWHDLSSSRDTHYRQTDTAYGLAFRLRYMSNTTDPVDVIVETQYRNI